MVAASEVTPGVQYHIKLVIADRNDSGVDSAVFIEGGSFDIGQPNLGDNRIIEDGSAMCSDEEYVLTTGLDPDQYLFQWTKDGNLIPGATSPTYTVTQSGLYGVLINAILGACEQNPEPVLIEMFDELEISNFPRNLLLCPNLGNTTVFDLTDSQEGVTTQPVFYSYFLTQQDALNNVNSISPIYSFDNSITNPVTIWVRITGIILPCSRVESFTIGLDDCSITLQNLPDMSICLGLQPNSFNVLAYKDVVYYGTIGFTVTFYHTEDDALNQTNSIDENLLSNYVATDGETIWVRVQDDADAEVYGIESFDLLLNELPVVNTPTTLNSCEILTSGLARFDLTLNQQQIIGSQTGIALEYYATYAEAELGDATLALPSSYVSYPGVIYIRVVNADTGCYIIVAQPLVLIDQPVAFETAPLVYCGPNNDGFGIFNLEPTATLIAGNPIPTGLQVTYHETLSDATNNTNRIVNIGAYQNVVPNTQTLYVRVGYQNSSCSSIVPLQLIVNATPIITTPTPLEACDSNNDGVANFDLTTKVNEILNGLNPNDHLVSFYTTDSNAISGTNPILNSNDFSNNTTSVVFVRVENVINGCFKIVRLTLKTNPVPVVANPIATYQLCDTNFDGFEMFDLASKIPSIVGTQTGLEVTFHYTAAEANSGTNALPSPYQNVAQNVQTLYVRVSRVNTGCFTVSTMDIRVNPNPVLTVPATPFEICSNTDTTFGTVDLTSFNAALLNGGPAYELKYYETQVNAENNVLAIPNPATYNNLQASNPSVWVRATNLQTGCFSVYQVHFRLVVSPKMPLILPTLVTCDVQGDLYDGLTPFDLTQHTQTILDAQVLPGTYVVRYYLSENLAIAGTNWIANPEAYMNVTNPQTMFVRVHNAAHPTSCFEVKSFTIKAEISLQLGLPAPILLCDNGLPNDQTNIFDLTIRENQITQGEIFGTTIKYYLTEVEAKGGFDEIQNPTTFINTVNPQTIWVAVENMYGCMSYTTLTIRVLPLPEPNLTPTPLEMCEDVPGSGFASFDLRMAQADLSNGNATLSYKYFLTEQEAINNTGAILTFEDYYTDAATIYVRVSNNPIITTESCFVIVPLELKVNSLPQIGPLTTLYACEENTDGKYTFDLTSKYGQILNGLIQAEHTIRFYISENAAILGTTPISNTYTNSQLDEQTIWVRLQNIATGCYTIAELDLKVEEKVFAFPPSASLAFCDTDGVNDGFGPANISTLDEGIISEQNLTDVLDVRYYSSWANYAAGIVSNKLAFPVTSNPQLVIAEVFNTEAGELCTATVEFYITMSQGPVFDPIADGYACVDFRTGNVQGYLMDTGLSAADYNFIWTFGNVDLNSNTPSFVAVQAGVYTLTVVSRATNCPTRQTINVQVAPAISIDAVNITDAFSETNSIEVIAVAAPGVELEYALDEGAYQDSNIFVDVLPGTHTVWVKVKGLNVCAIYQVINVLNYPKFFTPNNDGYNDTWNISALKDQPEAKIYIFDRQGKLLKQLSPAGAGWDGTFNNSPLPSTDYWFRAEFIEPKTGVQKEATGHFTLKR